VQIVLLLVVACGGGGVAWAIAAASRRRERRNTALHQIAAHFAGDAQGAVASGRLHGIPVMFRFTTHGSGSNARPWTEIDVEVPASYPLAIHLRRHAWLDKGRIARGDMIDLQLGDPAFDEAFLVEAAPEDIARGLLDAGARSFLLAHGRIELDTVSEGDLRFLRFALQGWIEDVPAATLAIDHAVRFGARVREAYAAADSAVPVRVGGAPYRPALDAQPMRDASAARVAEVAALEALRAARARRHTVMVVAIMVAILIVWLAMMRGF
jgi:hypothetical protein